MTHSLKTRRYTLWCLAARTTAFCALLFMRWRHRSSFSRICSGRSTSPPDCCVAAADGIHGDAALPSHVESLGCQKVFARRCRPAGKAPSSAAIQQANHGAALVALAWICGNALIFLCHAAGWLGLRFLVCGRILRCLRHHLHSLFLPLPDPLDAQPMLHHLPHLRLGLSDALHAASGGGRPLAISACVLAAGLFLRWEVVYHRHPERFF